MKTFQIEALGIWKRIGVENLIAYIAKARVDDSEVVLAMKKDSMQSSVIELKTSTEDSGKSIDKRSYLVVAIRTVLSAAFFKLKKRYILDLLD
jgi:predicted RNA-binding protein YlqC (UPF0109 family)